LEVFKLKYFFKVKANLKIIKIGIMMGCTYIPSVLIIGLYFEKKRGIATGITMAGSGILSYLN
jgi:hypothetical protein